MPSPLVEYAQQWHRDPDNNFALACADDNSVEELEAALQYGTDAADIATWHLAGTEEWRAAVEAALAELRATDA
jgi:hypothetical protein